MSLGMQGFHQQSSWKELRQERELSQEKVDCWEEDQVDRKLWLGMAVLSCCSGEQAQPTLAHPVLSLSCLLHGPQLSLHEFLMICFWASASAVQLRRPQTGL